ncbi:MAG: hypothetical protein H0W73_08820 [Bacteroidetes bacterium]|nr:hypothetical protein [Bacteroidota bacterium]
MKKLKLTAVLAVTTLCGFGQINWTTALNNFTGGGIPRIGTSSNHPIIFITNGTPKMTMSAEGNLIINNLAGTDERPVYVDANGTLKTQGFGYNCNSTVTWYGGGNKNMGTKNNIGTCDNSDFILKANDNQLMFIKAATAAGPHAIGIGPNNNTPSAMLDITKGVDPVWGTAFHTRIYGDVAGTIETMGAMTLISSDGFSYKSSATNPSTEFFSINSLGTAKVTGNLGIGISPAEKLHVAGGNLRVDGNSRFNGTIGINANPSDGYKVDIHDPSSSSLRVATDSYNPAKIAVGNAALTYDFNVDATGVGHIHSEIDLLHFKPTGVPPNSLYPQVWIGKKPTTNHTAFSFAVDGAIVAKSLYLTLNCGWADYVFAADYQLPKLEDVETYYKTNKHLPEMPSAEEVEKNGVDVTEMNILLLKKIEELTLYVVDQQKKIKEQESEIVKIKVNIQKQK